MRALLVAVSLLVAVTAAAQEVWQPPNVVQNPGFETVDAQGVLAAWHGEPAVYSAVTTPAHSGSRALQYVNDDAKRYVMFTQTIAAQPGKSYEVSAWIKTENVQGADNGATVCMEWTGRDGKWLGGHYPSGFKGTTDWKQLKSFSGRLPAEAASVTITCYVRKGMTGKAWWDDVEVRQHRESPMDTMLLSPNYRGQMLQGTQQAVVQVDLNLTDYELEPEQVTLQCQILGQKGKALSTNRVVPSGSPQPITVRTADLAPGNYQLKVSLLAKSDKELGAQTWPIQVLASQPANSGRSYIDSHNRLIVDGKPFFPLGMYAGGVNETDVKLWADSPFNCVMPYGAATPEQMDLLAKSGLKIIYSVKDAYFGTTWCPKEIKSVEDERPFIEGKVKTYGNHPALLAWYLNDELGLEHMARLEAHQQWMQELDPNHPTWIVLYQVGLLEKYRRTFDAIGTDPYPIPSSSANRAGEWTRASVASVGNTRPVWMVPQVFNWGTYSKTEEEKKSKRPPTPEEMRSMTWQCIAEGAKGLIYYSFMDLRRDASAPFDTQWARVKQMASEVKPMIPVILSVEPAPEFTVKADAEGTWLHYTTRRVGGTVYLIAASGDAQAHQATFDLGATPKSVRLQGQGGAISVNGQQLKVDFAPHGVQIYEMQF